MIKGKFFPVLLLLLLGVGCTSIDSLEPKNDGMPAEPKPSDPSSPGDKEPLPLDDQDLPPDDQDLLFSFDFNNLPDLSEKDYRGLIIDFKDDISDPRALIKNLFQENYEFNLEPLNEIGGQNIYLVQADHKFSLAVGAALVNPDSELGKAVEYAEPNHLYRQASLLSEVEVSEPVTSDPLAQIQWNFNTINLNRKVWAHSTGTGTVVAVIDSGVIFGRDLDETRFVPGYDFIDRKAIEKPDDNLEAIGGNPHGSNIAGIIGQETNNGFGFSGIAPDSMIMPVQVFGSDGTAGAVRIALAIRWAARNGAEIINLSLAGEESRFIQKAINYAANKKNVLIIAAAGNEGGNAPLYPASDKNILAVGAYGPDLQISPYSNRGERVDIFAPGGVMKTDEGVINQQSICKEYAFAESLPKGDGIYQWIASLKIGKGNSETINHKSVVCVGTSQATAHVTGVAALVISILKPHGLAKPDTVKRLIVKPLQSLCLSDRYQKLDASKAVIFAKEIIEKPDNFALATHLSDNEAVLFSLCECAGEKKMIEDFGPAAFSMLDYRLCLPSAVLGVRSFMPGYEDSVYQQFDKIFQDCLSKASGTVPTWEINNSTYPGSTSLDELADLSGYTGSRNFVVR
ncbi:MAG: S8 family serine peptidase [Cyanobacteria bacterium P01_F01_bin.116]